MHVHSIYIAFITHKHTWYIGLYIYHINKMKHVVTSEFIDTVCFAVSGRLIVCVRERERERERERADRSIDIIVSLSSVVTG